MTNSKEHVKIEEKRFDFAFLLISQTSLIIYSSLIAIGSIISLSKEPAFQTYNDLITWLTFVTSVSSIFQSILQTICIKFLYKKLHMHKAYVKVLILLNFSIWLFDTFSSIKHDASRIQRNVYGESIWEILCIILIPLSIFYRIHSSIILIKLNARVYNVLNLID